MLSKLVFTRFAIFATGLFSVGLSSEEISTSEVNSSYQLSYAQCLTKYKHHGTSLSVHQKAQNRETCHIEATFSSADEGLNDEHLSENIGQITRIEKGENASSRFNNKTISLAAEESKTSLQSDGEDGTLMWKFRHQSSEGAISSPAISHDGNIYFGSFDRHLYSVTKQGALNWVLYLGSEVRSTPAVSQDGTIYVGAGSQFYSINPDGEINWQVGTGGLIWSSPALASDGTVYVLSSDTLYAYANDGAELWAYKAERFSSSSPTIGGNGVIYFPATDGYIYAINPDGSLKWRYLTGDGIYFSSVALGHDETVYVGSGDGHLYALNSEGNLLWRYADRLTFYGSPVVDSQGNIYTTSFAGSLFALERNGQLLWEYKNESRGYFVYSSPVLGADGTVYVGSRDTDIHAIDSNGTLKWTYETYGWVNSTAAIDDSGLLLIGSDDGFIYAINTQSMGLANGFWPKKGFDNQHTSNRDYGLSATDSDGDGLTDFQEANLGTDPLKTDTDGDGLSDSQEVNTHKTDPLKRDSDDDGFSDGQEIRAGSNPVDSNDHPPGAKFMDYDGDGKADMAFRRPSTASQYVRKSSDRSLQYARLGLEPGDIPITGDFDGDGKADFALRRPANQFWYILNSSGVDAITGHSDGITRIQFGKRPEDIPVPADYDGDGITDLAVRRPSNHYWYVKNSSGVDNRTGNLDGITRFQFGRNAQDIPVVADYDGDGLADFAIRRPSNKTWYVYNSGGVDLLTGNQDGISRKAFGRSAEDIAVPADYDGDGRADLAVRRPSNFTWYVLNSSGSNYNSDREDGIQRIQFGRRADDIPVTADYDGDGITDFAVRRSANRMWYVLNSSGEDKLSGFTDGISRVDFGLRDGDIPIASPATIIMDMVEQGSELPVENVAPVARISTETTVTKPNERLTLDGSQSFDEEGDEITWRWQLVKHPAGSEAYLENAASEMAELVPDVEGVYTIALTVSDQYGDGEKTQLDVVVSAASLRLFEYSFFSREYEEVSMPYQANYTMSLKSGNTFAVGRFRLMAEDGDFTVKDVIAIDSSERVVPYINGLDSDQVIRAGEVVGFQLVSPATGGDTVFLEFGFTVEETRQKFSAKYQYDTN